MSEQTQQQRPISWTTRRDEKARRMQMVEPWLKGPVLAQEKIVEALESVIVPGDRIVMEGDNQKQADFLSRSLVQVSAKKIHDLHLIKMCIRDSTYTMYCSFLLSFECRIGTHDVS